MHGWLILSVCVGWLAKTHLRDRLRARARAHHRRPTLDPRSPRP